MQSDSFLNENISVLENQELTLIHDQLESLVLIKTPTIEQANELSRLLTKSGDIMLNTNLVAQHFNESGSNVSIAFIALTIMAISIAGFAIYKRFVS